MAHKRKRSASASKVEVDMVPMIDIISLLLMFLVIVGDTTARASSIHMQLPRNIDQAMSDKELVEKLKVDIKGRIVVQLDNQFKDDPTKEPKFRAVINNQYYDLMQGGGSKSLIEYLNAQINYGIYKKDAATGAVDAPVKLRIPENAPMKDVEDCVMALARVGLVNVQYAADGKK